MLSFWEPVRPAVNPALAPVVVPGAATNGALSGPLAEALALLVTRVGGEAPQLSLESLHLGEVVWCPQGMDQITKKRGIKPWIKGMDKPLLQLMVKIPTKLCSSSVLRPTGPQRIIRKPP